MDNSFNVNDPLVQQNKKKIKHLLDDPDIILYFVASNKLKQIISEGKHPLIQGITTWMKYHILEGSCIVIQKRIVWEMINKTLDKKNTFVFSNGDIRLKWENQIITDTGVGHSDLSLMNDWVKK